MARLKISAWRASLWDCASQRNHVIILWGEENAPWMINKLFLVIQKVMSGVWYQKFSQSVPALHSSEMSHLKTCSCPILQKLVVRVVAWGCIRVLKALSDKLIATCRRKIPVTGFSITESLPFSDDTICLSNFNCHLVISFINCRFPATSCEITLQHVFLKLILELRMWGCCTWSLFFI